MAEVNKVLSPRDFYIKGRGLLDKGNILESIELASDNINNENTERKFWATLLLADCKRKEKEYKSAETYYHEASLLASVCEMEDADRAKLWGKIAYMQQKMGNHDQAVNTFLTQAIHKDPENLQNVLFSYSRVIISLFELKDWTSFSSVVCDMFQLCFEKNTPITFYRFMWTVLNAVESSKWLPSVKQLLLSLKPDKDYWPPLIETFVAFINKYQGNYTRSLEHVIKAKRMLMNLTKTNLTEIMLYDHYVLLKGTNKLTEAKLHLLDCLEVENISKNFMISIFSALSLITRFLGNYEEALKYAGKSVDLSKEINSRWDLAYALFLRGIVYTIKGMNDEALEELGRSLQIYEEDKAFYSVGHCLGAIAWVKTNQKKEQEARKYYEEAISLFQKTSSVPLMIYLSYAKLLSGVEGYKKRVSDLLDEAKTVLKKNDDNIAYARYYNTLGSIYLNYKNYGKALHFYFIGLSYSSDVLEVDIQIHLGIAKTYLLKYLETFDDEQNLEKALESLKGLEKKTKDLKLVNAEIKLTLANIYIYKNQYEKAKSILRRLAVELDEKAPKEMRQAVLKSLKELEIYIIHSTILFNVSKTDSTSPDSINTVIEYLNQAISYLKSYNMEDRTGKK